MKEQARRVTQGLEQLRPIAHTRGMAAAVDEAIILVVAQMQRIAELEAERFDLFVLGFNFDGRRRSCDDGRDLGRTLGCDDFPEWFQAIAAEPEYPGRGTYNEGIEYIMRRTREILSTRSGAEGNLDP